ncbi:dimethyl sulfoxide reductase anchor subunit [Alphaproteobacteria bacterium KMM 3653]|uniref:Dimethyl sulfoxide reductase anchor subunit n=1 Tax=Harenicola maris TaxID=2841044 RepID=A0AAP2CP88_9RHOB|nr:dimethyl sulfoxide reductase anchor subunit [Harenicola maris]
MHPAYSVILFTTASGAGYGLLFWLGLGHLTGLIHGAGWMPVITLTVALGLITLGLLSSAFHLGRPERALGAFSQWRSSWLSREGVVAVATYVPAGLWWLLWLFGNGSVTPFLGLLAAIGAAVTVYCTGMIYASLRTIRQWNRPTVPWIYIALAAGTGGLLLALLLPSTFAALAALISLGAAAVLKLAYWKEIDADPGQYTAEMATGLGHLGTVRPLDPPHSTPNFVMREMGYAVARNHALKLRKVALLALFALPLFLIFIGMFAGWLALVPAVLLAAVGVVTERWLFFAEAEHVSQLYYGKARA